MAVDKKTVAPVAAAKVEAPKAEVKKAAPTTPVKTETKTAVKEAEKAPVAKAEVKAPVKAEVKKPAAKKETAKKAELKSEISVQFGGKSYSQEDLLKIAKDVWKYDLKQKAADLTSIELYVKPEENMVYYVMNKETTGSFYI